MKIDTNTKKLSAVMCALLVASAVSEAAPIANAPLTTPVLVDSTGKLMGRYSDMSLLITFKGETLALPLRQRTVFSSGDGAENKVRLAASDGLQGRPGLDWQEGQIFTTECFFTIAPPENTTWINGDVRVVPIDAKYAMLSRYNVQIFGSGSPTATTNQVMYASIASPTASQGKGLYYSSTVTLENRSVCKELPGFVYGLRETDLINLDKIGIAPFHVQ